MVTMPIFDYLHFVCEQSELEGLLKKHGREGWRLLTCDPVATYGPNGSGLLNAFVVMDKFTEEEEQQVADDDEAYEGIAMKG